MACGRTPSETLGQRRDSDDATLLRLHFGRQRHGCKSPHFVICGFAKKSIRNSRFLGNSEMTPMLLGAGQEGEVRLVNGFVEKQFHIDALTDENVAWLKHLLLGVMPFLPEPSWSKSSLGWLLRYPWFETAPVDSISIDEARQFLLFCLSKNLVCANIKRSNFRRRQPTGLTFVDIGAWILPMNVDYFRDSTARLFAICKFQWSDDEIRRRSHELREPGFIECLPGFTDFYAQLLQDFAQSQWHSVNCDKESSIHASANDVTLLIKACAMDAEYLTNQLTHIVEQLSRPLSFKERVLLIDPFRGPFLLSLIHI